MTPRFDFMKANPNAAPLLMAINRYLYASSLGAKILNLVEIRASQINGCARCLEMHCKEARAAGESEERLYVVDAWREAPFFDERERAALAWTEAVTRVAETHVPDDVYESARRQFSEAELVDLTLAVTTINAWNRLNIAFRSPAGGYRAGMLKAFMTAAE